MKNDKKDIFTVIEKLPAYSRLLLKLYGSRDISKRHKLILSAGIAYSASPIDLIPGIIPVAGQLDNLLVMLNCIDKVLDRADPAITSKYLEEAGITRNEVKEDIKLAEDTLKSIGRDTAKVLRNTGKAAGYLTMYGIKKLIRKKPY
ncbi:MAG: YkvA family protein [Pseudomonadota bacterium]